MKNRTVCKSCRKRHVKCDYDPKSEDPCEDCRENGRVCEWTRPVRFQTITFEPAPQKTKRTLSEFFAEESQTGEIVSPTSISSVFNASTASHAGSSLLDIGTYSPELLRAIDDTEVVGDGLQRTATDESFHSRQLSTPHGEGISPVITDFALAPFRTKNEAEYFLHYKNELALWLDVCDHQRHFSRDVPRRAMESRLLLQSIYAWGSLHHSMLRTADDLVSYTYYNEALNLLIPLLNDPDVSLSDELLAAIVILRSYEEFLESDKGTHLFGSAQLLDHLSSPASPGAWRSMSDFSKAARWVILRQWIYFALTRAEPMKMRLEPYITLTERESDHDEVWCNQAVLLFARVLESSSKSQMDPAEWKDLHDDNERWMEQRPETFLPIWDEPPSKMSGTAFPVVLCREDVHVIGLQHYHLSRAVLAMFDPDLSRPGFDAFKRRKNADNIVIASIKYVIGLAISNSRVMPACFHACHILQKCGYYIREPEDRQQTVQFLNGFAQTTQWPIISNVLQQLKQQWQSG